MMKMDGRDSAECQNWEKRDIMVILKCGEAYAWVPDLRSFDKLREVGVFPYLGFTLYLSVLQCFGWYEAF